MGCCFSSKFKSNCTIDSSFNAYADGLSSRIESGRIPLNQKTELEILNSSNLRSLSYNNLRTATRNFRPDSLLGEGGFGCVFKGWINEQTLTAARPGTGMVIAVKRLNKEGFQGQHEWLAEINYLSQLHHPNVVKLIGYCTEEDERLLVYEFVPRGSLENHLFRRSSYFQPLSWDLRMKVALGAAKGLAFLHSQKVKVIYRDFKSSNILVDTDYTAKLSDFGLAKDGPTGEKSHVSTRVLGTHGYAAPEYMATGHLTTRSDVYSFGVVLLELMTGRRALDTNRHSKEQNLTKWARPYLKSKRKFFRIMDTRIQGQYCQRAATQVGLLAMQCLSPNPRLRPNMRDVVAILGGLQGPENEHISRQQHGLEKVNPAFGVHRRRTTTNGDGGRKHGVPNEYALPRPQPVVVCA